MAKPSSDPRLAEALEVLGSIVSARGTDDASEIFDDVMQLFYRPGTDVVPWLRAARILGDTGAAAADEVTFLIFRLSEGAAGGQSEDDPEMARLMREIDEIRRAHGLAEDEDWLLGEGPEEWETLNHEWEQALDRRWHALLTVAGEHEIAPAVVMELPALWARVRRGAHLLFGEPEE